YADYLYEQGDPRGDLIQVQLALERTDLPEEERKHLQGREKTLLNRTEVACLGPELVALRAMRLDYDWACYEFDYTLRRGWLHSISHKGVFNSTFARALESPQARLLR